VIGGLDFNFLPFIWANLF